MFPTCIVRVGISQTTEVLTFLLFICLCSLQNYAMSLSPSFSPVEESTPPQAIEEAFKNFTEREDIAIILINQYVSPPKSLFYI